MSEMNVWLPSVTDISAVALKITFSKGLGLVLETHFLLHLVSVSDKEVKEDLISRLVKTTTALHVT